jgi:4-diphosphocytidyl-2C-methyl-D-erythritol kinase
LGSSGDIEIQPDWNHWTTLGAKELLPLLVNDLEAPAFAICPELNSIRLELEKVLGRVVRMSGSGSTLFTLFDVNEAEEMLQRFNHSQISGHLAMAIGPLGA